VTRAGDGWRITAPSGRFTTIHSTPSDVNTEHVVTARLAKLGFIEAEKAFEERAERDRQRAIAEDEATNRRRTKLTEERSRALIKAQGEYAVEGFDADWLLAKHPAPAVRCGFIDAALAEKMLSHDTLNRPPKVSTKRMVTRALREGRMLLTHEAFAFDTDAILLDGGNRLRSIVETGIGAHFWVFVGMDPATRHVVGRGAYRTAGDTFSIAGVRNANRSAAAVRMVAMHKRPYAMWDSFRPDNDELLAAYDEDPDGFQGAQHEADRVVGSGRVSGHKLRIASPIVSAGIYILRHSTADQEYVSEYLHGLMTGADLKYGDARQALHDWANNVRRPGAVAPHRYEQLAVFILAWNNHVAGNRVTRLHWKRGATPFPMVAKWGTE